MAEAGDTLEGGHVQLRHLRSFIRIVEAGSISRAAARHHIAQPALSQQMAELERALGVMLLHRGAAGVRPTEAGEVLLRQARAILDNVGKLPAVLRSIGAAAEPAGRVVLGLLHMITVPHSVAFLDACRERHPRVVPEIVTGHSVRLRSEVAAGNLDLALVFEALASAPPGFVRRPLFRQRLHLVQRRGLGSGPVDLAALAAMPLVLPLGPTDMRNLLEAALATVGAVPRIVGEIQTIWGAIGAAQTSDAGVLTVAADLSRIPGGTEVVVRPIAPPLHLTASVISRADPPLGLAGRAVQESLAAFMLEIVRTGLWIGAEPLPATVAEEVASKDG